jgi:hypothetical protein
MLVYREAPPTGWKARCHCRPALPGPVACAFQSVGGGRQYSALFRTTGMSKYNVYRIDRTAGWFFFCQKIINARGCLYSFCVYLNDDMMRRPPGARSSKCHSPRNLCCEPQPHDARACVIHTCGSLSVVFLGSVERVEIHKSALLCRCVHIICFEKLILGEAFAKSARAKFARVRGKCVQRVFLEFFIYIYFLHPHPLPPSITSPRARR